MYVSRGIEIIGFVKNKYLPIVKKSKRLEKDLNIDKDVICKCIDISPIL